MGLLPLLAALSTARVLALEPHSEPEPAPSEAPLFETAPKPHSSLFAKFSTFESIRARWSCGCLVSTCSSVNSLSAALCPKTEHEQALDTALAHPAELHSCSRLLQSCRAEAPAFEISPTPSPVELPFWSSSVDK